jgi:hypothetical protein
MQSHKITQLISNYTNMWQKMVLQENNFTNKLYESYSKQPMKQHHMYLHNVPFHYHFLTKKVCGSGYNILMKDSVILGYDTISLGNQLWHFETAQCFQTVGNVPANYTSYSRRPESSTTPLWRTQDSTMQIK